MNFIAPAPAASSGPLLAPASSPAAPWTNRLSEVYEEYCQLWEAGTPPDPEEFCARYPAYRQQLAEMLSVHELVNGKPELLKGPEAPWPQIGDTFAGFKLLRELGRGGFARVFLAHELELGDRTVVVKISSLGQREAQTLGRLAHPNIVPVYSVRTADQTCRSAVCMPFLGEVTFADLLAHVKAQPALPSQAHVILQAARRGHSAADVLLEPADRAALASESFLQRASYLDGIRRLTVQLLDALAFMHGQGVFHRDLKPSNVLLTRSGVPMLLDFNLSADNRLQAQAQGGTPGYAPPEQLRLFDAMAPAAPPVDARADLFSLGVIIYELLTGRFPFALPETELTPRAFREFLLAQHAAGARPVRSLNPAVAVAFAELVDRCLAYAPSQRPASAAAARALLPDAPPAARPPAGRRKRSLWAGALTLAVCLATAPLSPFPSETTRAWQACRLGDRKTAVELFSQRLARAPDDRAALVGRGTSQLRLGQAALAAADFERALQLRADGPMWAALAYALQENRNHAAACTSYQRALDAGYQTAAVYNNLGFAYLKANALTEAEVALSESLRLDDLMVARLNRGSVYLTHALRLSQATSSPRFAAPGCERRRMLSKAYADLNAAHRNGPASGELFQQLARTCAELAVDDPAWTPRALDACRLALQYGLDPTELERRPFTYLLPCTTGEAELPSTPAPGVPTNPPGPFAVEHLVPIFPE